MTPVDVFLRWYDEAAAAGEPTPEVMALATATAEGRPSVRYVLYRGISGAATGAPGLRFFTNYESRKSRELMANPRAAAVFYWQRLGRQVRFEGAIERLDAAESDAYFAARPRGHQLAAWASPQSRPINYPELLERQAALERQYAEGEGSGTAVPVPRPPHWGGWRLRPDGIELWQQHDNRLHERTAYALGGDGSWVAATLGP